MPQIPSRIFEIVQQLKENKQPKRATVRKVLKWFNAARRGANVVAEIQETLALAGLDTEPSFSEASIDEPLRFFLRSCSDANAESASPTIPDVPEAARLLRGSRQLRLPTTRLARTLRPMQPHPTFWSPKSTRYQRPLVRMTGPYRVSRTIGLCPRYGTSGTAVS